MQLRLTEILACLCACFSYIQAASSSLVKPDAHIIGSSFLEDSAKPTVLKFDLIKKDRELNQDVYVRSCYGAHFKPDSRNVTFYWILPAECLDRTKYDMIWVKYGYKNKKKAQFNLIKEFIHIHPDYNSVTKAHNIGMLRFVGLLDTENGYTKVQLPNKTDNFDDKILELYEYSDGVKDEAEQQKNGLLRNVKTKPIRTTWCQILYPLSPIRNNRMCLSGWPGKGLTKNDLGVPLISRDGDTFKLVGLATVIRSWTHFFSFPIEVLRIQPYIDWIKSLSYEQ